VHLGCLHGQGQVHEPGHSRVVNEFALEMVPVRHVIIDDGWQTTGSDLATLDELPATQRARALSEVPMEPDRKALALHSFYSRWVEHAPAGSFRLEAWAAMCRCLGHKLRHTFASEGVDQAKRLRAVSANGTFELPGEETQSLGDLVKELKVKFGVRAVYCWHHLLGYWCGLDPLSEELRGLAVQQRPFVLSPGIRSVEPQQRWGFFANMQVGLPCGSDGPSKMYESMHSYLKDAGIDGVKVDGQSLLGQCGQGLGGGPALCKRFVTALEDSVQKHFGDSACICCMSHANENYFYYNKSAVIRACDDFLPDDPASQATHIAHCAFNGVFFAEIAVPDWDMFHSDHPSALMHAAARAVSGASVYVSDPPGRHDFNLLRQLVTQDGRVLLCDEPARPTRDCLFRNVQEDGKTALKVFNTNGAGHLGVVAAFNVQGSLWDRKTRRFALVRQIPVTAEIRPCDVETFRVKELREGRFAVHLRSRDSIELLSDGRKSRLVCELPPNGYEVATISPVMKLQASKEAEDSAVCVAPIGLRAMLNPGGAIRQLRKVAGSKPTLQILGRGSGIFAGWSSQTPEACEIAPEDPAVKSPLKANPAVSYDNKLQIFEIAVAADFAYGNWSMTLSF